MLRRLTAFYESHGISPVNFHCPSRSECAAGSPDFTEAKMSSVPPRYGMPGLPRLLFLSLDSGSGSSDPRERTAEAVRQWNVECDVAALPRNKHWYRTHELAFELLRQFKPDLTVPETRLCFAHVNSAKCCQNKSGRKRADSILFENCRRFIPAELGLLGPDVVVTQGGRRKPPSPGVFRSDGMTCARWTAAAMRTMPTTRPASSNSGREGSRASGFRPTTPTTMGASSRSAGTAGLCMGKRSVGFGVRGRRIALGHCLAAIDLPLHTGATCHEPNKESLRGSTQ